MVGVPDSRKGERLVVLHTLLNEQLHELIHNLSALDLPNLWRPRPNQFFHVAAFPYLGTGKLDLRKIREMALQISTSA